MDGRTGFRRNKRKTKSIKSYKGQEFEESHDRLQPEGTAHKEDKEIKLIVNSAVCYPQVQRRRPVASLSLSVCQMFRSAPFFFQLAKNFIAPTHHATSFLPPLFPSLVTM